MKRFIIVTLTLFALFSFSSCGERDGLWGLYKSPEEQGNFKSVEFAYSKVIYIDDQSAVHDSSDGTEDDGRDEGWYTQDGEKVVCRFTKEKDGETVESQMSFDYDEENNTLTLTQIKTTVKNTNGEKTENTEEYNLIFKK